jgi:hypothetical protein
MKEKALSALLSLCVAAGLVVFAPATVQADEPHSGPYFGEFSPSSPADKIYGAPDKALPAGQNVFILPGEGQSWNADVADGQDATDWVTNLPQGLEVATNIVESEGVFALQLMFSGTPETATQADFDVILPANSLVESGDIPIAESIPVEANGYGFHIMGSESRAATVTYHSSQTLTGRVGAAFPDYAEKIVLDIAGDILIAPGKSAYEIRATYNATGWFTNMPEGVTATVTIHSYVSNSAAYFTFSGEPATVMDEPIEITVPADYTARGQAITLTPVNDRRFTINQAYDGTVSAELDNEVEKFYINGDVVYFPLDIRVTNDVTIGNPVQFNGDEYPPVAGGDLNLPAGLSMSYDNGQSGSDTITILVDGTLKDVTENKTIRLGTITIPGALFTRGQAVEVDLSDCVLHLSAEAPDTYHPGDVAAIQGLGVFTGDPAGWSSGVPNVKWVAVGGVYRARALNLYDENRATGSKAVSGAVSIVGGGSLDGALGWLQAIDASYNHGLTSLTVQNLPSLEILSCHNCNLSHWDFADLPELTGFSGLQLLLNEESQPLELVYSSGAWQGEFPISLPVGMGTPALSRNFQLEEKDGKLWLIATSRLNRQVLMDYDIDIGFYHKDGTPFVVQLPTNVEFIGGPVEPPPDPDDDSGSGTSDSDTSGSDIDDNIITTTRRSRDDDDDDDGSSYEEPRRSIFPGENTVAVEYIKSGDTITAILPADKVNDLIDKAVDNTVTLDMSGVSGAETARLPTNALARFANEGLDVELELPGGSIRMDDAALRSVLAAAKGGYLSVTLVPHDSPKLNDAQRAAIGPDDLVYEITLTGGETIHEFEGAVTVTVEYDGPAPVSAWYMNSAGALEKVEGGSYDAASKTFTFTPPHLSLYVVGYDETGESIVLSGNANANPGTGA